MNGYTDLGFKIKDGVTMIAGNRVKLLADGTIDLAGVADVCIGIVQIVSDLTATVSVQLQQNVKTAASLVIGDTVTPSANGLVVKGTGTEGEIVLGIVYGVYNTNVSVLYKF